MTGAANIVKVAEGITRQRSANTSHHEVVRHLWLDWRLQENHNKGRKITQGFQIGGGYKPVTPEDM